MWMITSNDVQQARSRLQARREKLETRYAEETKALDTEFTALDTLERIAEELTAKSACENEQTVLEPAAQTDPIDVSNGGGREEEPFAASPSAEPERHEASEAGISLDILKPGSRWRMYRGARPADGETSLGGVAPSQ